MMKEVLFEIISNDEIAKDVFRLSLKGDTSAIVKPGQFVNIKLDGFFLRRPLSVCDLEDDVLTVVYKAVGGGTEALSNIKSGALSLLTGLGNGFDIAGSTGSSSVINTLVTDPGFVDFANKNYALTAGPAIDAALSGEATLVLTTVDAAGNPRKTGKAVDIGALECVQSEPACSFIAKKTTVLENDPAILTLYAIGVGDTPEYTISFGDETAAVVTTDTTVEHAYAHSGVYTVTVSVPGVTPKTGTITVKPKNLYVKEGGTGAAPYASEDQAAGYIEDALAEAGDGCTIWLKKGNYTLKTKTPIEVKKSVTIRGATGRPEDVIVKKMSGGTRPFTLSHASAVLADLTVTGGSPQAQNNHGSNVRITSTGGVVTNCIIRNGYNGQATTGGGGLAMAAGLVTHCVISNNYAHERGTGVFIEGGKLENCLISGNYGGEDKGHHDDSGTVCVNGSCSIINCTIANNRAERCPSIYFMGGSNQKVINCLLFGNKSTAMTDSTIGVYYPSGKASLFTACAAPFKINDTCFTADDLKINAEYRPMAKSVCRDNATTSGITVPQTDLAGNPRLDEETGKLDIGCRKWINFAARSVFAVYVIHQIPAFMHYEWHTLFRADWLIQQSAVIQAIGIPAVAILVFAGASLIDTMRIWLEPHYLALRPVRWLVNWFSKLYPESECS